MNFEQVVRTPEFERDFKKLQKRYRTLGDDVQNFIKTVLPLYEPDRPMGVVRISDLGIENPEIYKAKKFACKSLKGKGARSGIRVIFSFFQEDKKVELIEIYYKGDRENEDRKRILRRYK